MYLCYYLTVSCEIQDFPAMRNPTDLRQKVLNASLTLIKEGGLDRLSMREVARKAGVSHQAPYHYFEDREAILAGIAGEGFSKLEQSLVRAAAEAGAEPIKAVEGMGRAYIEFAMRHPAYFQVRLSRRRPARSLLLTRASAKMRRLKASRGYRSGFCQPSGQSQTRNGYRLRC
jgi:AcrR family transcriptional regulator